MAFQSLPRCSRRETMMSSLHSSLGWFEMSSSAAPAILRLTGPARAKYRHITSPFCGIQECALLAQLL